MVIKIFVIEKDKTVYIPRLGLNTMDMSFYVNNSEKIGRLSAKLKDISSIKFKYGVS